MEVMVVKALVVVFQEALVAKVLAVKALVVAFQEALVVKALAVEVLAAKALAVEVFQEALEVKVWVAMAHHMDMVFEMT